MNTAEEKLWNYIDDACTPAEREAIELQIAQDAAFAAKYRELLALNSEFAMMELDEPPMAFTYNVMESIRNEYAATPLKSAINKNIIKGIGLFFVLLISALLIFAFSQTHLGAGGANAASHFKFSLPNFGPLFTGPFMQVFCFLDIVLALYLFDNYLRKKRITKTDISVQSGGQPGKH